MDDNLPLVDGFGTTPSSWVEAMQRNVQAILAEDDNKGRRMTLFVESCSVLLAQCEDMAATSILEMALWKRQLKGGWSNDTMVPSNRR
ncbi:unnamed protein product [Cylindrotheca closterium]|uniref:Uncharacterized protein n=1 Tax=Cylindrotheca closterium TaxID=2856 RepID=A0AAD2FPU8_9STRA|nr:unnamed protein product [Cylindrotheca closterium]